jgi:NAD(P)-dependent dehydrogenase (short-subunit alcohol dehydrogenase family)
MRLQGKVALITGGAGGIGRVISRRFAREGAAVVVADLLDDDADEVVRSIREAGGQAVYQPTDVTRSDQVEAAVGRAVAEFGRLTTVVNLAGWLRVAVTTRQTEEDFDRTLASHVKGTWLVCKTAMPELLKASASAQGASIVNISSMQAYAAIPGRIAYEAAKAGISAMTRAMAVEFGPGGVRVNAVCPGMIEHERTRAQRGVDKPYDHEQRILAYPLRRLGQPEDVSNVVLFLASDEASWMTGTDVFVDGGISVQLAEALMYPPFRELWNEAVPGGTPTSA